MTQYQQDDKYIACAKCANEWNDEVNNCDRNDDYEKFYKIDFSKYNNGYIYNGVFAIKAFIDKNINHKEVCRICHKPTKDNRMVGGNGYRYHDKCFYSYYGHID